MDVFDSNAFSMQTLTLALNDVDFVPGRLGQMGIFAEAGVTTTTISIEKEGDTLALVPVTERGSPPTPHSPAKRTLQDLRVVRLALEDEVYADEIQNVRAFGSETTMETLQSVVNGRNAAMGRKLDATLEHHRMGAVQGQVLDSDGSAVLYNLFTIFGVSAQSSVDWDLDNATPASGILRTTCSVVIRLIEDELGGIPIGGVTTLCSASFFDALVAHSEVRETYLYQEGAALRERTARRSVFFGGISFEEYRGAVGAIDYLADDASITFPTGVVDLFVTRFAPADYEDTVNTMGLPKYARQFPDPDGNRYRRLEVQTNVLNICTRPRTLIPGTLTG
jgi:hypothetical protein